MLLLSPSIPKACWEYPYTSEKWLQFFEIDCKNTRKPAPGCKYILSVVRGVYRKSKKTTLTGLQIKDLQIVNSGLYNTITKSRKENYLREDRNFLVCSDFHSSNKIILNFPSISIYIVRCITAFPICFSVWPRLTRSLGLSVWSSWSYWGVAICQPQLPQVFCISFDPTLCFILTNSFRTPYFF